MSDSAALLAAIRAALDDDAPRLVYADWLGEHGQTERAEFIRVQIELARNESPTLRRREAALLAEHHDVFVGLVATPGIRFRFQRGFVVGFESTTILAADDPKRPNFTFLYLFRAAGSWQGVSLGIRVTDAENLRQSIREYGATSFTAFDDSKYAIDATAHPAVIQYSTRSRVFRGSFDGLEFALEYPSTKRKRLILHCTRIDFPDFDAFLESES